MLTSIVQGDRSRRPMYCLRHIPAVNTVVQGVCKWLRVYRNGQPGTARMHPYLSEGPLQLSMTFETVDVSLCGRCLAQKGLKVFRDVHALRRCPASVTLNQKVPCISDLEVDSLRLAERSTLLLRHSGMPESERKGLVCTASLNETLLAQTANRRAL